MKQHGQKSAENQENREVDGVSSLFEKADLQWLREHVSDADGFKLLAIQVDHFEEEPSDDDSGKHTGENPQR